ncbi:MAG: DUF2292 domain-containing protein [Arenimonas sp.]
MNRLTLNNSGSVSSRQELSENERAVLEAIRATPYGSVEVVVHQSRIVQVVKTEKVKLEKDWIHKF